MLNIPEMSQAFEYILDYTDIFLPSDGELDYLVSIRNANEQVPVDKLLKRGVKHVVIKRGPRGASYFKRQRDAPCRRLQRAGGGSDWCRGLLWRHFC